MPLKACLTESNLSISFIIWPPLKESSRLLAVFSYERLQKAPLQSLNGHERIILLNHQQLFEFSSYMVCRAHKRFDMLVKGESMLGCKKYCYPLTITDTDSRYLIVCEGLE